MTASSDVIEQNGVTMRERSASAVLSGQTNAISVDQQRSERELFGKAPINRLTAVGHGPSFVDDRLQFRMKLKIGRRRNERIADARELLARHRRIGRRGLLKACDLFVGIERVFVGRRRFFAARSIERLL